MEKICPRALKKISHGRMRDPHRAIFVRHIIIISHELTEPQASLTIHALCRPVHSVDTIQNSKRPSLIVDSR